MLASTGELHCIVSTRALVRIERMVSEDVPDAIAIDGSLRIGEEELRVGLTRPWTRGWVAREDGTGVVAFVQVWHVVDELHVLSLATRADRRRRGIARGLMDAVLAYACTSRVRLVLLEVRRSNAPAIELYRGVGFSTSRVRARYYQDDEDALEMSLSLDPETGAAPLRPIDVPVPPRRGGSC
jgi:ribosomal-protein-alanine N-acetyltransferase